MTKQVHPVFGELVFELFWKGTAQLTIYGEQQDVELMINAEEDEALEEAQAEAYLNFRKHEAELIRQTEAYIYAYYLSDYEARRNKAAEELDDEIEPQITDPQEMTEWVTLDSLFIDKAGPDGISTVGLLFDCAWDIDDGLAVRIRNGAVLEIGKQSIII